VIPRRQVAGSGVATLRTYLAEIGRIPLLSPAEERSLAKEYRENGDSRAAHKLVSANLRFVVKVAYGYRFSGLKVADLIQEGNLGLMRSLERFDPDRDVRLISYAVWWIRAYIQAYILRSWSVVKLGTTQAQRKLFFSFARTWRELQRQGGTHGQNPAADVSAGVAHRLNVRPADVSEMRSRIEGRDVSLDEPVGESDSTRIDFLASAAPSQDDALSDAEELAIIAGRVQRALGTLDARERYIVQMRLMSDEPMTLKALGDHFGFTRERTRQLEARAAAKLRLVLGNEPSAESPGHPIRQAG